MNHLLTVSSFLLLLSCESPRTQKVEVLTHPVVTLSNKIDPICKMDVQKEYSDTLHYKGSIIGFCSIVCKERFVEKMNQDTLQ